MTTSRKTAQKESPAQKNERLLAAMDEVKKDEKKPTPDQIRQGYMRAAQDYQQAKMAMEHAAMRMELARRDLLNLGIDITKE